MIVGEIVSAIALVALVFFLFQDDSVVARILKRTR